MQSVEFDAFLAQPWLHNFVFSEDREKSANLTLDEDDISEVQNGNRNLSIKTLMMKEGVVIQDSPSNDTEEFVTSQWLKSKQDAGEQKACENTKTDARFEVFKEGISKKFFFDDRMFLKATKFVELSGYSLEGVIRTECFKNSLVKMNLSIKMFFPKIGCVYSSVNNTSKEKYTRLSHNVVTSDVDCDISTARC